MRSQADQVREGDEDYAKADYRGEETKNKMRKKKEKKEESEAINQEGKEVKKKRRRRNKDQAKRKKTQNAKFLNTLKTYLPSYATSPYVSSSNLQKHQAKTNTSIKFQDKQPSPQVR